MPYNRCHGCGLCTLVCPAWQQHGDVRETPKGLARALQYDGKVIAEQAFACVLCGACEPVCPQQIDLIAFMTNLRRRAVRAGYRPEIIKQLRHDLAATQFPQQEIQPDKTLFLPSDPLRRDEFRMRKVTSLLSTQFDLQVLDQEIGAVSAALEAGIDVPLTVLNYFLAPLRDAPLVIVDDGLLLDHLRIWLPQQKFSGLGIILSKLRQIHAWLKPTDLYVIESRAFHNQYRQALPHYHQLQQRTECKLNWDLQRLAIPTARTFTPQVHTGHSPDPLTQLRWMLRFGDVARIVVEDMHDHALLSTLTQKPVIYVAELAQI